MIRHTLALAVLLATSPVLASDSVTGDAVTFKSPNGILERCIRITPIPGGNYSDGIGDPTGTDGNISLDPVFCGDANEADPYTLRSDSPCLAANNPECGRIGARGLGCSVPVVVEPILESVADVGNDQGRHVRQLRRGLVDLMAGNQHASGDGKSYRLLDRDGQLDDLVAGKGDGVAGERRG